MFKMFQENLARKEKVQKRIGVKFETLSEKEQEEHYQLAYLAELLVEIYLDQKCREGGHKIKKCEECRKNLPFQGF